MGITGTTPCSAGGEAATSGVWHVAVVPLCVVPPLSCTVGEEPIPFIGCTSSSVVCCRIGFVEGKRSAGGVVVDVGDTGLETEGREAEGNAFDGTPSVERGNIGRRDGTGVSGGEPPIGAKGGVGSEEGGGMGKGRTLCTVGGEKKGSVRLCVAWISLTKRIGGGKEIKAGTDGGERGGEGEKIPARLFLGYGKVGNASSIIFATKKKKKKRLKNFFLLYLSVSVAIVVVSCSLSL